MLTQEMKKQISVGKEKVKCLHKRHKINTVKLESFKLFVFQYKFCLIYLDLLFTYLISDLFNNWNIKQKPFLVGEKEAEG